MLRAVSALLTLLTMVYYTQPVYSCDCRASDLRESYNKSAIVFSGKVIKINYLDDPSQTSPEPRIIVTFKVYKMWKGELKSKIVIHTVYNKWTCNGFWFQENKEYFVFSYNNDLIMNKLFPNVKNSLGVDICNGTMPLADAQEAIQLFGPGKSPK